MYVLHSLLLEARRHLFVLEELVVGNTSITGGMQEMICQYQAGPIIIEADCLGPHPEVNCSCCTYCCSDTTGEFEGSLEAVCERFAFTHEHNLSGAGALEVLADSNGG